MNISDYKFKVGDRVITTRGEIGRINNICTCEKCKERGFFEPEWIDYTYEQHEWITNYEAENNFHGYYSIGEYKFSNEFEKDFVIDRIDRHTKIISNYIIQLKRIEEIMAEESSCESIQQKMQA